MRQGQLRAQEGPARIDLHHQVVALHLGRQRARERNGAGVVDADVDSAECGDALRHRSGGLLLVADVADQRQRLAAEGDDLLGGAEDRPGQLGVRLGRLRREDDVGAVARQPARDRQADAAAGAGNEDRLVAERHGRLPVSCASVVDIVVAVNRPPRRGHRATP